MEPNPALPFTNDEIDKMVADSVEKVFSTMMSTTSKLFVAYNNGEVPPKNHPKLVAQAADRMQVVGMIGFLGAIRGVMYIYVDEALSIEITSNFLGMNKDELKYGNNHETINDAIGELCNMTSGTYKNQLCDKGFNCRLTIPSILRANNFTIEPISGAVHRMYQFEVFGAAMGVEVVMVEGE